MHRENVEGSLLVFLVAAGLFVLAVLGLSRFLGADFEPTLRATGSSLVLFVAAGAFALWQRPPVLPTAGVVLCIFWPIWWPVLSSMARGSIPGIPDELFPYQYETPWWNTSLFRFGFEAACVAATGFLSYRAWNDRY
jgi:hypothetical protein